MPTPETATVTTGRLYVRLPSFYRTADQRQTPTYPLLTYIASVVDRASLAETLWQRIDYTPLDEGGAPGDTSDLADPYTADLDWLAWIGQFFSVTDDPSLAADERRRAVAIGSSGWRGGTKAAVSDAARTELVGSQYVRVYDHTITLANGGAGKAGMWDVLLVTRPTETPDVADVLAAVSRLRAKPAGVLLRWEAYEASWDTIETAYPTWADIEAAGSWDAIQETVL